MKKIVTAEQALAAIEAQREYKRKYYQAHKAEFCARTRKWQNENKEKKNATTRAWRAANKEKCHEYQHDYYAQNKEKIAAQRKGQYLKKNIPLQIKRCKERLESLMQTARELGIDIEEV